MTSSDCQPQLQQPYRRETWQTLLPQLLPGVELFAQPQNFPLTSERELAIATARRQFGAATLADGKRIAFYEIEVAPGIQLLSNRVGLRNLIARCIDEVSAHAVLAFFVQPGLNSYRLTYAAKESTLNVETRETATRRFTYILGPSESCRTAAQRFAGLPAAAKLSDLTDAFSVEKLNKEFFADFCRSFDLVSKEIRKHHAKWSDAEVECEAQTILDRLVFLYFVQRKGWLNRQRDYLFRHFREQHASKAGHTYFQQFLRPLFVKLSTEGSQADIPGHDLPFLNGGLFNDEYGDDQSDEAARRRTDLIVGNDTLHYVFENLLERYNFTIHEDSPTNQEVAIDPEMLGKIFESLVLQIEQSGTGGKSLRHDTGSHYTPRPIVHYLCVGALAAWLESRTPFIGKKDAPQRIAKLLALDASEGLDDDERETLDESLTPEEATALLDALATLRACDPAVGSGAFPMGLLRELLNLARLCETRARGQDPVEGDRTWLYEAKKRIIERVIYGVDIQERAIEICKLRLWLSLMVDNDLGVDPIKCDARSFRRALGELEPLPNLDFKIRRADSLVDKIHGEPVELGKLARETGAALPLSKLTTAKRAFFHARKAAEKRKLRLDIYQAITELAKLELTRARTEAGGMGFVLDEKSTRRVVELDHGLKEIAFIAAQIHDARKLRAAPQDEALERIRARFDDPQKPTFVWQLDFAEVFHRESTLAATAGGNGNSGALGLTDAAPWEGATASSGFDIVLANPPYVRHERIKELKPFLQNSYECYTGTADLYVYFYERAVTLLNGGGVLSFISSNKYYRAGYGEKLRAFLARELTLHQLVDFGDAPVFEAIAYASILIGSKSAPGGNATARAHTWEPDVSLTGFAQVVRSRAVPISQNELKPDGWRLESPAVLRLLEKLRRSGKPLGELPGTAFFNGIKTGLNPAFVFTRTERDAIVSAEPEAEALFKPFLRGRDVKRWRVQSADLWLLYLPWHFPLHADATIRACSTKAEKAFKTQFPIIHKHLNQFSEPLRNRDASEIDIRYEWYALSRPRFESAPQFAKPKVVIPTIVNDVEYAVDREGYFSNDKTTLLACENPEFISALLNSKPLWWFIRQTAASKQGGFYEFKPMYVSVLPIPVVRTEGQKPVERLVERILAAKQKNPAADTSELEHEIDQHVYALYALTPEEIKLVEASAR